MGAHAGFGIDETPIWTPLPIEGIYWRYGSLTIYFYSLNYGPVIVVFIITNLLHHGLHKVQPIILTDGLLEGEVIITWLYVVSKGFWEDYI